MYASRSPPSPVNSRSASGRFAATREEIAAIVRKRRDGSAPVRRARSCTAASATTSPASEWVMLSMRDVRSGATVEAWRAPPAPCLTRADSWPLSRFEGCREQGEEEPVPLRVRVTEDEMQVVNTGGRLELDPQPRRRRGRVGGGTDRLAPADHGASRRVDAHLDAPA